MAETERRSYKSFTEVKETLSPAEERFERYRNTIGLFLGPLVALIIFLFPMPGRHIRCRARLDWGVLPKF